jgi:hypothetical protein
MNPTGPAPLKKILRISTGVFLVIVGITGLILPIMPGWVFLIPGLIILADYFPWIHRTLEWAKRKATQAGVRYHDPHDRNSNRGQSGKDSAGHQRPGD